MHVVVEICYAVTGVGRNVNMSSEVGLKQIPLDIHPHPVYHPHFNLFIKWTV